MAIMFLQRRLVLQIIMFILDRIVRQTQIKRMKKITIPVLIIDVGTGATSNLRQTLKDRYSLLEEP